MTSITCSYCNNPVVVGVHHSYLQSPRVLERLEALEISLRNVLVVPEAKTLRDEFAMVALALVPPDYRNLSSRAKWAYGMADAMMAQREKKS